MLKALIIVDVQPDFCEGGKLAVDGGNDTASAIADFLEDDADLYDVIITTQDWHSWDGDNGGHFSETPDFVDTWPSHCVAGTEGAAIHEAVEAVLPAGTFRFKKGFGTPSYSGFEARWSDLLLGDFLFNLGIENAGVSIDIVGIATSHCVKATALDAAKKGFKTTVLKDYCVGVTPELAETAYAEMRTAGVRLL